MLAEIRRDDLATRGSYSYSSLGAATAGQATANAAGMTYDDLMRTRLFEPLGMRDTTLQTDRAFVADGRSPSGLPVQPWIFDAYAPAEPLSPQHTTCPSSPPPCWTAPHPAWPP
jgi:CubicO group peptidase (beta-lactamase class C family)